MEFGKSNWKTFDQGIQKEWLLTNGIGGFACSTIIGANTRRYHGLLVASLNPPVARHLILSKIDESIIVDNEVHNIYSYQTPDFILKGYHHLESFSLEPLPMFVYRVKDVFIKKKISMIYGKNTVVVTYKITNGKSKLKFKLTPLVNFRDYHFNASSQYMNFSQEFKNSNLKIKPYNQSSNINIYCSEGKFIKEDHSFFFNMDYAVERERGLQSTEDHYIPGYYEVKVAEKEIKEITFIATIEGDIVERNGMALIKKEEDRINKLTNGLNFKDEFMKKLVVSADNFIVHRNSTDAKTVIAGFPWFTDWGRDTMIALPGLTLATGRFEDAKEILFTFSKYVKYGLIPNVFPDIGEEPAYNTVDAPLWYFEAISKYLKYTNDYEFVKDSLYPSLKEIIDSFIEGTKYKIKMDDDYLISAGDEGTQLTWMDAKVGNWVVTPRHGKAVEINALWFNALKVMAYLSEMFEGNNERYVNIADKVKENFTEKFWNEERQCLYDVLSSDYKDDKVRPNQILAVSLGNNVIDGEKAEKIVNKVLKELYTSYGLRSLSPYDEEYKGIYVGDQYSRDGAYHQGTVWTWPLGQFITAYIKVNKGNVNSIDPMEFIKPFESHLNDGCIGSISEIFDGDEPLIPRGCFAQAWSVSEILRAYVEDVLPAKVGGNGK